MKSKSEMWIFARILFERSSKRIFPNRRFGYHVDLLSHLNIEIRSLGRKIKKDRNSILRCSIEFDYLLLFIIFSQTFGLRKNNGFLRNFVPKSFIRCRKDSWYNIHTHHLLCNKLSTVRYFHFNYIV